MTVLDTVTFYCALKQDALKETGADTEPTQGVAGHLHRQFPFAVDGLDVAAERANVRRLGVAVGSDDEIDPGMEFPRPFRDEAHSPGIGRRDDEQSAWCPGPAPTSPASSSMRGRAPQIDSPLR